MGLAVVDVDEIVGRFLQRAEQLRTIASNVEDSSCRQTMLAWAEDYDHMVDEAIDAIAPAESRK